MRPKETQHRRASLDRSDEIKDETRRRAGEKRLDHAGREPEDRDHGGDRKRERPGVDGPEQWYVKGQPEAAEVADFMKPGMQGEPDSKIEDNPDYGRGDAGERPVQRLVIPQTLDERRAEADP